MEFSPNKFGEQLKKKKPVTVFQNLGINTYYS